MGQQSGRPQPTMISGAMQSGIGGMQQTTMPQQSGEPILRTQLECSLMSLHLRSSVGA